VGASDTYTRSLFSFPSCFYFLPLKTAVFFSLHLPFFFLLENVARFTSNNKKNSALNQERKAVERVAA
jgi:hypothetical protein